MPLPTPSDVVARAVGAAPTIATLDLEERLRLAAESGHRLERQGEELVESAVRELAQPRRFAERELRTARELVGALPALAAPLRARDVPAVSGRTRLEWAPYGVVLGWHAANSPVWVPTVVVLSGLVAGNAVVSRPSQRARQTSSSVARALATPWPRDAVVVADIEAEAAMELLGHPDIGAIVAHGSTETCRRHLAVLGRAYERGARLRPYIPEASGNDAMVVLDGADLRSAANAAAIGGFANGGQLCMAAKRVIVQASVWPRFAPLLAEAVASLTVGRPEDPSTEVVPLREGRVYEQAMDAYEEALGAGGVICAGWGVHDGALLPTVIELPLDALHVTLWRSESFAPLRGLVVVEHRDDAVRLANDSPFGLGAAVFGGTEAEIARLRAARVIVDEGPLYSDPHLVVGGVGDSGFSGARPKVEQLAWARRVHRAEHG